MFGKNILKERTKLGYSKEFAAINIGCTVAALNSYEAGKRSPSLLKAKTIADFYMTTIDELLELPGELNVQNIANLKLNPDVQETIDRNQKMLDAGMTKKQIEEAADIAIAYMTIKKPT